MTFEAMTPERWQQIRDMLDQALQLEPGQRSGFLDRGCSGDDALRREVEVLLASSEDVRSSFLESPPPRVTLAGGTKLGEYEIKSLLGAGGMGEVYRARDSRLGRDVAIKVLPRLLSADAGRLRRFEQEARAAAALSHPNILAVFQMGTYEAAPYLVSELLDGETLREQIKRGALSMRQAADDGVQIAHGLSAAHEKGVIHRDLKPENLFVTKDGRVKILDFGLAKLTQPGSDYGAPTLTVGTEPGMVMGTVGYMSPEQVRGQTTDPRTDIFSFGAILYEMLTGKRAFHKPTAADTMSAILNEDPAEMTGSVPPGLQRVVYRCLEKSPARRFQSASDLAFALDALSDSSGYAALAGAGSKPAQRKKLWRVIASAAALLATILLAAGVYYGWHQRKPLSEKDTIVLADFENKTGDGVFDDALRQALIVNLRQSRFLNVLSDRRISATLQLMGHPANEHITAEVGREICLRTGSKALLDGTISSLGRHYLIELNAVDCSSGDVLAEEQGEATSKEDVLKALSRASSSLRAKLGESLPSLQQSEVPVAATTSSLEALKSYSMGIREEEERGYLEAIPFMKRALELDPNFPRAYAWLAVAHLNLHQPSVALGYATKAYQLRDRVSDHEKLSISLTYFNAAGELDKMREVCEVWVANYPRDFIPRNYLGSIDVFVGQYDKAAVEFQEALQLAPDVVGDYASLEQTYLALNRVDDAKAIFDQALSHKLDGGDLRQSTYLLAFLSGDDAQMEQQVAWATDKPGVEDVLLSMQSDTEAYYGRLNQAREFSRRAEDSASRAESKEIAAMWKVNEALREAELGNVRLARQGAMAALAMSSGRDVKVVAALALARIGEVKRAKALADELEKSYPVNTLLKAYWLPSINAAIELNRGNSAQALADLEAATPYELGSAGMVISYGYPEYLRGEAYLLARNGTAAAAEFQKLLDHRGVVLNFVTGALTHLQIGRAYAMAGDAAKSKGAYEDFFAVWKNADPDIPILKQAKAEYAKLR